MSFKVVGFKMPQELSDRIDECVAHLGVQRTSWVRDVIARALAQEGFPVPADVLRPKQGARNDIPNRITEAEKRSRKGMRPRGRPRKETSAHSTSVKPVAFVRITDDGELEPISNPKPARSSRTSAA